MNWFNRFVGIVAIVFQVVQIIERVLIGQPGAVKKGAAVDLTNQLMADSGAPPIPGDDVVIDKSIETAVKTFNGYGLFAHPLAESQKPQHHEECVDDVEKIDVVDIEDEKAEAAAEKAKKEKKKS